MYTKDGECNQTRRCQRAECGKTGTQVTHDYAAWHYVAPRCCDQVRRCVRDGHTEARTEHDWDVWKYAGPTSCDQVQRCLRCSDSQTKTAMTLLDHQMKPEEIPKISCTMRMGLCKKCGMPVTYAASWAPATVIGGRGRTYGNKAQRRWPRLPSNGRRNRYGRVSPTLCHAIPIGRVGGVGDAADAAPVAAPDRPRECGSLG